MRKFVSKNETIRNKEMRQSVINMIQFVTKMNEGFELINPTSFTNPSFYITYVMRPQKFYAPIAQLVEQVTLNHRVAGSIPARRTC